MTDRAFTIDNNDKRKTREFKTENAVCFDLDLFILLSVAFASLFIFPSSTKIGDRNMMFLDLMFIVGVTGFMFLLEKYKVFSSGLREKTVITVLSFTYTLIILCAVNSVFFWEKNRLDADLFLFAVGLTLILLKDYITYKIIRLHYKTPGLLILGADSGELKRIKKVKYGMCEFYNAWYETLDGVADSDVEKYAAELFENFEGVCIFNDFSSEVYEKLVNLATAMGKDIYVIPKMVDVGKINASIVRFSDIMSLQLQKYHVTGMALFVKRVMDIFFASVMSVFAAVPMLIIALLIKLTSPGPVFYKQQRLTKDKKVFWIYKFRTMIPDAEKQTGPVFAQKNDPRITPIGRLLRSLRLDELPQLLNILKGEMSMVGPRPERPEFAEQFRREIQNYDDRFKLKAGLTSLSHVYGRYSTHIYDRTYYDLYYITNYSILFDLKIMLLTSKTMFLRQSAEGVENFDAQNAEKEETPVL